MVKVCKVKNCTFKSLHTKSSLFSVPKCPKARSLWEEILKCKLEESAHVCENHFRPCDIKSSFTVTDQKTGTPICNVSVVDFLNYPSIFKVDYLENNKKTETFLHLV